MTSATEKHPCDMGALMDGGRETVGEYFASDATDHYGTLHEEIVRCRDCKHANDDCSVCYRYGEIGDDVYYPRIEPDGFCAWACRKEGGDD